MKSTFRGGTWEKLKALFKDGGWEFSKMPSRSLNRKPTQVLKIRIWVRSNLQKLESESVQILRDADVFWELIANGTAKPARKGGANCWTHTHELGIPTARECVGVKFPQKEGRRKTTQVWLWAHKMKNLPQPEPEKVSLQRQNQRSKFALSLLEKTLRLIKC